MRKRIWILLVALCAATAMAADKPKKPKRKKAPAAAQGTVTIPKDAVPIDDRNWRWVDKDGKVWVFQQTPFGVLKGEEHGPAKDPELIPPGLTAVEEGDSIHFERPWPFGGTLKWNRKKTELTEMEAAAWKQAQEASKQQAPKQEEKAKQQ
jgi:hypothetical protein